MSTIRRILVPTDFGDAASAALTFAIDLAERFGAEITLLHVTSLATPSYPAGVYLPPDDQRADAEKAIKAAATAAQHRWELVTTEIVEGRPAETILHVAERRGVDLVVMGTHGRGGLRRLALGSVAEHVVRRASVPVLIVRAHVKQAATLAKGSAGATADG